MTGWLFRECGSEPRSSAMPVPAPVQLDGSDPPSYNQDASRGRRAFRVVKLYALLVRIVPPGLVKGRAGERGSLPASTSKRFLGP
jgi:hypothetical protein